MAARPAPPAPTTIVRYRTLSRLELGKEEEEEEEQEGIYTRIHMHVGIWVSGQMYGLGYT